MRLPNTKYAGNYLADQNGNIDLSVVYMCNAYIAEKALQAKLGGTWKNSTLHTGKGKKEADLRNVPIKFGNKDEVAIDVKNKDICLTKDTALLLVSRDNCHDADILATVNEASGTVFFIGPAKPRSKRGLLDLVQEQKTNNNEYKFVGPESQALVSVMSLDPKPEFLKRLDSLGPISRAVYINLVNIKFILANNTEINTKISSIASQGQELNLELAPPTQSQFCVTYSDTMATKIAGALTNTDQNYMQAEWNKIISTFSRLDPAKFAPKIWTDICKVADIAQKSQKDWVDEKINLIGQLFASLVTDIMQNSDTSFSGVYLNRSLSQFKLWAESFYQKYSANNDKNN